MSDVDLTRYDLSRLDAAMAERTTPIALWWRDDDAIAATPALDRLLALAERFGAPMTLAAIPATLEASLAPRLARAETAVDVAVHGWAHKNHAWPWAKKSEFGAERPLETRLDEATTGLQRLSDAFGDRAVAAFVPPWNRIGDDLTAVLAERGFAALSISKPRRSLTAAPGLALVNVHFDPINWRSDRSLLEPQQLIDQFAEFVEDQSRVEGSQSGDPIEPIGLLTHHLVHDDAVDAFLFALLSHLHANKMVRWLTLREAMDAALNSVAQS